MLTYFHHATKGYAAFAQDWTRSLSANSSGSGSGAEDQKQPPSPQQQQQQQPPPRDDQQALFMDAVIAAARHQEASLRILKERRQYEAPMFWCSQLFYADWRPVSAPCA